MPVVMWKGSASDLVASTVMDVDSLDHKERK